ncbi:hypothetical protein NKH84_28380 [Mesorhizobium sp. M0902]|uniref:hypothetical protein n=1 Tax=Mesorhizobium sp. M0902 TaxID=2957021 RepID=UPI00333A3F44
MKLVFKVLSLTILAVCAVQLLYLYSGRNGPLPERDAASRPEVTAMPRTDLAASQQNDHPLELPPNQTQRVDFSVDESSFTEFSERDRKDQYLDWLLFTAIAALQPSTEEYNKILFDLPATRQGYMRPVGTFEFGETRARYIGDGQVLTLIPAGRPEAERKDFLASIADEQRKTQGGKFDRLVVVEYALEPSQARATLTRRGDIDYASLFSADYGYHEQPVGSLADLERFMSTVDDLTLAQKTSGGLLLGGRKILSHAYRSIAIEQVATVWQSEQKIQKALADWDARQTKIIDDFNARWRHRTYTTELERLELERQRDHELAKIQEQLVREQRDLKLVNGSGFSLDPGVDYAGLKKDFESNLPLLQLVAQDRISEQQARATSQALADEKIVPLLELIAALDERSLAGGLLQDIQYINSYQAARYDGALQGTEVGMVLFYTDLMAKLWTIDFVGSSPRRDLIPDFVDDPHAPRTLIYEAESQKLRYARLWLGPSDLGFQVSDELSSVFFAPNATRIYSAGSDPLHPGVELETSAFFAAGIDWWNDHYDEVARIEPEYQRLNQIMKWSIVIGWLNGFSDKAELNFLASVSVDHSKRFPDWATQNSKLKFHQWDEVKFLPAGDKGTTTEALPLLSGPVSSGGVSLASRETAKRAPIALQIDKTLLRSNLDYTAGEGALKNLEGALFTFKGDTPDLASMIARAKPEAKFRATTAQLANSEVERTIIATADTVQLNTRVGDVALGDLKIAGSKNGFSVGWKARDMDRAHMIARDLSISEAPDIALRNNTMVEAVIKFPDDASYAVKLRDSTQWVKLAAEKQPSVDIASGWQMRAAGEQGEAIRAMQASVIKDAELQAAVANQGHIVIETANDGKPFLRISPEAAPTGTRIVQFEDGTTHFSAWVRPPSEAVHLEAGSGVEAVMLGKRLSPEDLDAIRMAAANSNTPIVQLSEASRVRAKLATALQKDEFRIAALDIVNDTKNARLAIDRQIKAELEGNLAVLDARGCNEALHDLDGLILIYGKRPELTLRRSLLQIENGNIEAAVESARINPPRVLTDRQAFFEEVNARLAGGSSSAHGDLYRFAEYADWQDAMARPPRAGELGGSVQSRVAGDRFDFGFQLGSMPSSQPLGPGQLAQVKGSNAVVYHQDIASLNGIDWSAPVDKSLGQVVMGDLGKVIHLPNEDIAHFRPGVIWSPDHTVAFKSAQFDIPHMPGSLYQPCDPSTGICADNDSGDEREQGEVYLVVAK